MAGRKPTQDRSQIRTKRISVMLKPAVYDGLNVLARTSGTSTSDLVSTLVEAVVSKNAAVIEEFTAAQTKARGAVDLIVDKD